MKQNRLSRKKWGHPLFFVHGFRCLWGLVLFSGAVSLSAAVYTLRPEVVPGQVEKELGAETILTDRVACNGRRGVMKVGVIRGSVAGALARLRRLAPGIPARRSSGMVLAECRRGKVLMRYCLVFMGRKKHPILFSMRLNADDPDRRVWPRQIPVAGGAQLEQVIQFSSRQLFYVQFRTPAPPAAITRSYRHRLDQAGWRRLAGTADKSGIYVRKGRLLIFSAVAANKGGALCAVYQTGISSK